MSRFHTRRFDEAGVTLVIVALSITAILAMAAIAIDLSNARQEKRQSQNAADASALAGAAKLDGSPSQITNAVRSVKTYATTNYGIATSQWDTCTGNSPLAYLPPAETGTCVSFDSGSSPTKVRVTIPTKSISTYFGGIVGLSHIDVAASATAQHGAGKCVLCVLDSTAHKALKTTGSGGISVTNGNVVVNSIQSDAISITNDPSYISSPKTSLPSGAGASVKDPSQVPNLTQPGDAPAPDPLASVAAPPSGVLPPSVPVASGPCTATGTGAKSISQGGNNVGAACTINPGVWASIRSSQCAPIILNPGIYVITSDVTLNHAPCDGLAGHENLQGSGVLLYFACPSSVSPFYQTGGCGATPTNGAALSMTGGSTFSLGPPTSGVYQGITVFYDRTNKSTLTLNGGSGDLFSGAIYAKASAISMAGGGSGTTFTINSAIIANTVTLTGNANININFDPSVAPPALSAFDRLIA